MTDPWVEVNSSRLAAISEARPGKLSVRFHDGAVIEYDDPEGIAFAMLLGAEKSVSGSVGRTFGRLLKHLKDGDPLPSSGKLHLVPDWVHDCPAEVVVEVRVDHVVGSPGEVLGYFDAVWDGSITHRIELVFGRGRRAVRVAMRAAEYEVGQRKVVIMWVPAREVYGNGGLLLAEFSDGPVKLQLPDRLTKEGPA